MPADPGCQTADIAIQAATVNQGRAQAKQGQTGLFTTGFQFPFFAENAFNLFIFGTVRLPGLTENAAGAENHHPLQTSAGIHCLNGQFHWPA